MSKPLVLSYSALNTYLICPKRFYHPYVAKDLPRGEKSKEQLHGTAVHEALKKRLRLGDPLPEEFKAYEPFAVYIAASPHTMHVELKLGMTEEGAGCDFFADDVFLRGALDVVLADGECAWLGDWKTGKMREDPLELAIQALLLRTRWPELRSVVGNYIWLRDLTVGTAHDVSDTGKTLALVIDTWRKIQARLASGAWPADEGPLCGWCDVPKLKCEFNRSRT